jgi:Zn-dependent M28 family amino/carboxypeptidase
MKYLSAILFSLLCMQIHAQTIHEAYFKKLIYSLASDSLQGREAGSDAEKKALAIVQKETGYRFKKQKFSFNTRNGKLVKSQNLYFTQYNKAQKTILIGAHIDHIGMGGQLSKSIGKTEVHNGADDNASGVAMLIALMAHLKEQKKYNYIYVFYSGHEEGLFGSTQFAALILKNKPVSLVFNFDMLGRLNPVQPQLHCYGSMNKNDFTPLSSEVFSVNFHEKDSTRLMELDTRAFLSRGIPCLSFTTGLHSDYHKTSDDPETINYSGMVQIYTFLKQVLE